MSDRLSDLQRRKIACWMEEDDSPSRVQRKYAEYFDTDPPCRKTIRKIADKFKETGSVRDNLKGQVGCKR
jgi:hypothetical protein